MPLLSLCIMHIFKSFTALLNEELKDAAECFPNLFHFSSLCFRDCQYHSISVMPSILLNSHYNQRKSFVIITILAEFQEIRGLISSSNTDTLQDLAEGLLQLWMLCILLLCNLRIVKSIFTTSSIALSPLATVPLEGRACFTEYIVYNGGLAVPVGLLFYPTVTKQIPHLCYEAILCLLTLFPRLLSRILVTYWKYFITFSSCKACLVMPCTEIKCFLHFSCCM